MKTTLYLPDSLQAIGNDISILGTSAITDLTKIEDEFEVNLKDPCADNQLSITDANAIGDQLYYIEDTALVITPVVDQTVAIATCPLTAVLEFYDEQKNVWRPHSDLTVEVGQDEFTGTAYTSSFVQSFITADTGVFTVYTTRAASLGEYDPVDGPYTEIEMKITFTDPYSDEA